MKNKERFANEIVELVCDGYNFAVENGRPVRCRYCEKCDFYHPTDASLPVNCTQARREWGEKEYVEPSVDWSKVPVDAPIWVRDNENHSWNKRHFANYEDGMVGAWADGATSWSADGKNSVSQWQYAKLADEGVGGETE